MAKSAKTIRIGPLSLFALISMLFLATLAVLSLTTANASLNLAQLQSQGMEQQYEAEDAAQRFLASLDEQYSTGAIAPAADQAASNALPTDDSSAGEVIDDVFNNPSTPAVTDPSDPESPVNTLAKKAAAEVSSTIEATAELKGSTITAQFSCPNGRMLNIEIELGANGSLHIVKWNMTAKVNNAEAETLWSGM